MSEITRSQPAVRIQNITKSFGNFVAVDDVSFEIPNRCTFGLLGPNGAGKTTMFSLIASFLRPNNGSIEVEGINVSDTSALQGKLSILPQDAQFQANIPILEQIIFLAQLGGRTRHDAEKEATNALGLVGLEDKAKKAARTLSHGMTKRLGIAQAFLGNPSVVLLDEPTAGLDPKSADGIRDLIYNHKVSGTLVISSHDLSEIQKMCDKVAILKQGKLVECNDVSSITSSNNAVRMTFTRDLSAEEEATLLAVDKVESITRESEKHCYLVAMAATSDREQLISKIVQTLAAGGLVARNIEDGRRLESAFRELTD